MWAREHCVSSCVNRAKKLFQRILWNICKTYSCCSSNSETQKATAQFVKKYCHRLLPLVVLSLLSVWGPVPGKKIKEVSCERFQLCNFVVYTHRLKEAGCWYTFVCERKWTTWILPAIWKTIKRSYEHSLNSLMRNRKAWFLSNSREWLGEVEVAKWAEQSLHKGNAALRKVKVFMPSRLHLT